MARATPQIVGSTLNLGDRQIEIGTEAWFMWLTEARSFSYHVGEASFTARKQQRKGFWYWYAYARRDGRLHCLYLGRPNSLTVERLRTIARALYPHTEEIRNVLHNRQNYQQEQQEGSGQSRIGHIHNNGFSHKSKRLNIGHVRTELAEIKTQLAKRGGRKTEAGLQALEMAGLVLQALSDEREYVHEVIATLRKATQ